MGAKPPLSVSDPGLVQWFDPEANGCSVDEAVSGMLWWRCDVADDHRWQQQASAMRRRPSCGFCAGKRVAKSNCAATLYPGLLAEWHRTLNTDFTLWDVTAGSNKKAWWQCSAGEDHVWEAKVHERTNGGTGCPFCAGKSVSVTNSVATIALDVAAQWHPSKNGELTPNDLAAGSSKKVWWKCPVADDHEWAARVNDRVNRGVGCPFCAGRKVARSNAVSTVHPELAAEWHPTKNGKLTAWDVTAGSNKKVWWRCRDDVEHEWEALVVDRSLGSGCPVCAGQKVGRSNAMAMTDPELAAEWHPTKNGELTAWDVTAGTNRKIWWKCPIADDHEWEAVGFSRTGGKGCPFCAGSRASKADNFSVMYPELAAEWHPTKNGDLKPTDVRPGSNKKVWWWCDVAEDHVWEAQPSSRAAGKGCPFCANKKVTGSNCMATTHPRLAHQLHPTLNGEVTARDVVASTTKKLWWRCFGKKQHVWEQSGASRLRHRGFNCPHCKLEKRARRASE